jgi:hypothetical protein
MSIGGSAGREPVSSRGPDDDPIPIGEPDDDEGYDDDDDDDDEDDDGGYEEED